ncbi:acyltransferase [Streptantibioticus parmotrematis]|uniref:acyltransferase n=1 Tax=Streptantibioticus parmotrematis TaxID=2873249 RepID=UPI0033CEF7BD
MKDGRSHLHYVDLVRVLTVGLVIGVHTLGASPLRQTSAVGAVTIVLHVSREVFFLLTAFVLTYGSERRPVDGSGNATRYWLRFWRRRFLFVAVPYVVWSAVYFMARGPGLEPFGRQAAAFAHELVQGTACYHLYFLLVSMQIYLVFPLIRRLLHATSGHHGLLLAVSALFQVLFSLAVQQHWQGPAFVEGWLRRPDAWLPSYLGYVLAGAVAACHREALVAWTREHTRAVLAAAVVAAGLGVGVYLMQAWGEHQPADTADMVFQPVSVVESVAIAWAFLAAGLHWQDRRMPGRRVVVAISDASFGVYLCHPLLLQGLFLLTDATGLSRYAAGSTTPVALIVGLVAVVPLVYGTAVLLSAVARRTPLSLPLTGRYRERRSRPGAEDRPVLTVSLPNASAAHGGS